MNLYRIDLHAADTGAHVAPVCDLLGPRLFRAYARAVEVAREVVSGTVDARITRISGAGTRHVVTVEHGGRVRRIPTDRRR